MANIPTLPPRCGSWIVTAANGQAVCEYMASDKRLAQRVDQSRYIVVPASDYLAAFNGRLGYDIGTLAWQLMHMDWEGDEPATFADAARVLDAIDEEGKAA